MQGVGAALGYDVDNATRGAPELGCEVIGENTEFLNGIERNVLTDRGAEFVIVRGSVKQHVGGCGPLAVDGEADALRRVGRVAGNVSNGGYERVGIARESGKFDNLL